jgi:hypothetical protein
MPDAFVSHKVITLKTGNPGAEESVNMTGSIFICKEATGPFEMKFGDGEWFRFDQGLQLNLSPDVFKRWSFRAVDSPPADLRLEFYICSRFLSDARLNIVRDPLHYQLVSFTVGKTIMVPGVTSLAGGAETVLSGTGPAGTSYRKHLIVTNNDPTAVLEVYKSPTGAGNRILTVFAEQSIVIETDGSVTVKNETGTSINCRILELFYPA